MSENLVIHLEDNESPLFVFKSCFPNIANPEKSVKDLTKRVISAYTEVEGVPLEEAIRSAGKTRREIEIQVLMVIRAEHDCLLEIQRSELEGTIKKPLDEFRDKELLKQDCVDNIGL